MAERRRRDSNGAAWRAARRYILRTQHTCWICQQPVNKALHWLDPGAPQVDHIVPVAHGGDLLDRHNLRLAHRKCNRDRGTGPTLVAPAQPATIAGSRDW